jgi:autotransporter-associated beta strand protein
VTALLGATAGRGAPGTSTWTGGASNGNWSQSGNWSGGLYPRAGSNLSFAGSIDQTTYNDVVTSVTAITFGSGIGSFLLNGQAVSLGGNVTNSSGRLQTINLGLTITANRTFTTTGTGSSLLLGGVIQGAGGITKSGSGTLTLSAADLYTGATTVSAGTVFVNGSITSAVSVSGGAVFGGSGSSTAAVTVSSGGTLTGGNLGGVGTFTTTGAVTLSSGSIFQADFSAAAGQFDQVTANSFSLAGATLTLNGLDTGAGIAPHSSYVLLNNTGSGAISGTFAGLAEGSTVTADGATFTLSYVGGTGNDVTLTESGLSAVPEPLGYALVAGGVALVVAVAQRRRSKGFAL